MRLAIDLRIRSLSIGHFVGGIEKAQAKASGEKALERDVDVAFTRLALLHRVQIFHVVGIVNHLGEKVRAFVIHAHLQRIRTGFRHALGEMVSLEDVVDGAAVGYDVALEFPRASQLILKQETVGACGLAVDAVISAHDRSGFPLDDRGAKRRKVSIFHVMFRHLHIHAVPRRLGAAMHGEVLGS